LDTPLEKRDMSVMHAVIFLNENTASLPFRESLLRGIVRSDLPISVFIAFADADLSNFPEPLGTRALLVIVKKDFIAIGPLYEPGKSVCFSCLRHWFLTSGGILEHPEPSATRGDAQVVADLINQVLSRNSLTGGNLRNTVLTFDLLQKKRTSHPIYPLRDCNSCSTIKIPETWGLRIHCSSLTGIVRKMEITTTRTAGAYRAIAEWASPLPIGGARPLLKTQESHGRGRTREEAEQGCVGEALERYSLIYRGDEPLQRARLCEITGVDPREILLYSENQYETRDEWNHLADERYFVGERFDPEDAIDWFPGMDVTDGSRHLLPAACVLMWYMFRDGEREYARADTIGCGSGWTFEDALSHALLEWIERDAMAIWWYDRIRRPAVNLESFDMPELIGVRDDLRRIGRNLILLDCTTDIQVPTYVSLAPREDGTELLFAGASHPSPRVAAWKAASEVGQLWFGMVHSGGVDVDMKPWLAQSIETQPYFIPTHEIEAPPEPLPLSPADSVKAIIERLRSVGLNVYAADLSRTDVILKTVRTIVPGLRHIWNRRGPGRLYDVPVRLGWLDSPLWESQLNPICCMI
jgi:bacteriocin biosynthesis cyclodehydratase domain-containing protein